MGNMFRRNVERMYVERLTALVDAKANGEGKMLSEADRSDVHLIARQHAAEIRKQIRAIHAKDDIDRLHLKEMSKQIDQLLKNK